MPFLLRKIRLNRWDKDFWVDCTWLDKDDIPIDPFFDLLKEDKCGKLHTELSMWLIEDNKSNLERVIAAIAANCDNIQVFDYFLIDFVQFNKLNFKIEEREGETADKDANEYWHRNISHLSCLRLLDLIRIILKKYNEIRDEENPDQPIIRKSGKEVMRFIANGRSGHRKIGSLLGKR